MTAGSVCDESMPGSPSRSHPPGAAAAQLLLCRLTAGATGAGSAEAAATAGGRDVDGRALLKVGALRFFIFIRP